MRNLKIALFIFLAARLGKDLSRNLLQGESYTEKFGKTVARRKVG
jgi:hypothetical protein